MGDEPYAFTFKLPVVTNSPATSVTGAGDLQLFLLTLRGTPSRRWTEGLTIRLPTGQNDSLGSGKYSIGPAIGYRSIQGPWILGLVVRNYFSVFGPSSRTGVGQTFFDPNVGFVFSKHWTIGNSTTGYAYDWVRNRWTSVPLGFRIEKEFPRVEPLTAVFEMEKNLANAPGTPNLTIRTLVQWTLPGKN
jgi:hypothetical protein